MSLCAWLWQEYKALMFVPWSRWRVKTRLQPSYGRPWSNTTWSGRRLRNMSWCRKSLKTKVKTKSKHSDCDFSMWDETSEKWVDLIFNHIYPYFFFLRVLIKQRFTNDINCFLGFCLFLFCCGSQGGITFWPNISNKFINQLDISAYLTQNLFCYHQQQKLT